MDQKDLIKKPLDNDCDTIESTLNILLCCAGDVTNWGLKELLEALHSFSVSTHEIHIGVVVTKQSCNAFHRSFLELVDFVYNDEDEWAKWKKRGDPVLHIDLTKWADVLLLAPVDLCTMAKIATGICDDLLTCTLRAWNLKKPIIFCPAISERLRKQKLTQSHIAILQSWGYKQVTSADTENLGEHPMVNPAAITNLMMFLIKGE